MQLEIKTVEDSFSAYATRPLVVGDKLAYFVTHEAEGESYLMVTAKRPDGRVVKNIGDMAEGGQAVCFLEPSMYSVPGELQLRLTLFSGNSIVTVREIFVEVLESLK
ncbi:MAG: hypothetical protein IJE10_09000 [Clostridia bacterium]|nr:hypothetical protein [Clostridia bacterium]